MRFGITADTGGHIAYVLDAATAQADLPEISEVAIVTRLFDEPDLPAIHAEPVERLGDKLGIERIATSRLVYLEKEALAADLPDFAQAFCDHLARLPRLPDVVHAHFADAAFVAAEARRRFAIPFVYTPHALGQDKLLQGGDTAGLHGRIASERAAIAGADAIVVSTRDEADRQVRAYGVADAASRTHCLSPGVPRRRPSLAEATVEATLQACLDDAAKPIVLAIARPVRKKNLAALVRAYASSPGLRERANLVILAGQRGARCSREEEAVMAELHQLCAAPALHGRVMLPDRHDAADVEALYARAARGGLFVNPALHEPFGLTLLEAAAHGVPVVATRHGGAREVVERIGHGTLVCPYDPAAIAAACLAIVTDVERHRVLSQAGRRNVRAYDWSRYARASLDLYASLRPAPSRPACDLAMAHAA